MFDISVGYDLEGIRSGPVVRWLESMRDAGPIVDELRREIPDEFARFRDYPFRTCLAAGVTLSTFHGTPAREVEKIGEFLVGELGFHTVIKLNPPMLGRNRVEEILHGVLGYDDVTVNPDVYERDLPFDEAVDVVRRLQALAARRGVTTGVKCGNTLEVLNAGTFLKERVQYLSGQPLHALHAALALQWREAFGAGPAGVVRRGRGRAERGGLRGRGAGPGHHLHRSPPGGGLRPAPPLLRHSRIAHARSRSTDHSGVHPAFGGTRGDDGRER